MTLDQKIFIRQYHMTMTMEEMSERIGLPEEDLINFYTRYRLLAKKGRDDKRKATFKPRKNERDFFIPKKIKFRPFERPKAEYTNSPSPYGIADEVFNRNLKKQCYF